MSPFSRGGASRDVKMMARPEGAQALRAIPKPCRRAVFPRRQLSPLPKIGEGFGEWSEAPSYEEGVGVDGKPEGLPSEKEGSFSRFAW